MTLRSALIDGATDPVFVREAQARTRWRGTPVCLSLFVLTVGVAAVAMFSRASVGSPGQELGAGQMERVAYHAMSLQIVFVGLMAAVLGSDAIARERVNGTWDQVVVSELTPRRLVAAKLGASIAYALLFAVAALPVYVAVFLHSGMGLGQLLVAEVLTAATAVGAAAVGLLAGSVSTTAFTAGVVSCVVGITLLADVILSGEVPAPASGLPQTASQILQSTYGRDSTELVTDDAGRPAVPSRADLLVHPVRQANPLYALHVTVTDPGPRSGIPLGRIGRSLVPGGRSWSTWGLRVQPWHLSVAASTLIALLFSASTVRQVRGPKPARSTVTA